MLVGRSDEIARIRGAIESAAGGRASVLTVVGDVGVGKTALLQAATHGANDHRLLHAEGTPAESRLGHAALGTLLSPLRQGISALPVRQQAALETALALRDDPKAGADFLALGAGTLALLADAAVERPVLVVVDDLHWVDGESRRVLQFVARRLRAESVAMLLSTRPGNPLDVGGEQIRLTELDEAAAAELLRHRQADLPDDVVRSLVAACAGNPLALVESVDQLDEPQRRGSMPVPTTQQAPERVREAYAQRLAALSAEAQQLLLAAACEGTGDMAVVERVLGGTPGLDESIKAELVTCSGGRLKFRHPLLLSCVLHETPVTSQRATHARIASALDDLDPDRAVWHRAMSTDGTDPELADEMDALARRAAAAGRHESAARAFDRVGALTPIAETRVGRRIQAAASWMRAGRPVMAREIVDDLAGATLTVGAQARLGVVQARLEVLRGRYDEAAHRLAAAAAHLTGHERRETLTQALRVALDGRDAGFADQVLRQLSAPDSGTPGLDRTLLEVGQLLREFDVTDPTTDPATVSRLDVASRDTKADDGQLSFHLLAAAALAVGRIPRARELYASSARLAKRLGDAGDLVDAMLGIAFCDHALGRWNVAYASASEVRHLADSDSAPAMLGEALHILADIDAARGRDTECRQACATLRAIADDIDEPSLHALADRREALLAIGQQDFGTAALRLESAQATLQAAGELHPYYSAAPELSEVYLRIGDEDRARRVAGAFLTRTGPGSPLPVRARSLRLQGLLAPTGEYEGLMEESLSIHESTGMRWSAAQTLLYYGERLRRDRRRVDAKRHLLRALDRFKALDAGPWVARTESELAACGSPVSARDPRDVRTVSGVLTAQEMQVAVLVKEGLRNKDIASTLFLSLRTVEFHLSSAYRKLGVSGRTQLAAVLTG